MENTLLVGLSRQIALQRELDVVANNIANINTTGFKSDGAVFHEFLMPVARENNFNALDRQLRFVQDRATWHDLSQGAVEQTGNPLDLVVDGDAFLVVQTPRGERYTRNGALQISATGELVTNEGYRVLGDAGPIQFQREDRAITFGTDGTVSVPDGLRGKLRLVRFDRAGQLQKDGNNTFAAPAGVAPEPAATARVVQGAVEKSNVRAVVEMTRMIEVSRSYQQVAAALQQQGDLRRTAIERLADVPA